MLSFEDARIHKQGFSNPEEEGRIILDILSVLVAATWHITGVRVSGIDHLGRRIHVLNVDAQRPKEDIDLTSRITDVLCLDREALVQFIRASHAFNLGIQGGATDLALGFLLLVTSIECLSSLEKYIPNSELNRNSKSTERYVRFIRDFCADSQNFYGPEGETGFIENLKTVYYIHRSAFVHAGKEVPMAAALTADELAVPSVTHYVDGKEISTPGLVWFAQIVQRSLVGFLDKSPKNAEADRDYLQEIAARRGIISLPLAGDTPVEGKLHG